MTIRTAQPEIIDGKAVQSLVDAHAIRGAVVLGQPGGWAVLVRYGALERAVAAQRAKTPRLWRNLTTAAAFVRDELGLVRFEVDAQAHEADAGARRRPDQAARMKARHEAADHDAWFRAEVEKGIARADSPDAKWIPHKEVMAKLDARIARLKRARRLRSGGMAFVINSWELVHPFPIVTYSDGETTAHVRYGGREATLPARFRREQDLRYSGSTAHIIDRGKGRFSIEGFAARFPKGRRIWNAQFEFIRADGEAEWSFEEVYLYAWPGVAMGAADHRVSQRLPAKDRGIGGEGKKIRLRYRSRSGLPEGPTTADDFHDAKVWRFAEALWADETIVLWIPRGPLARPSRRFSGDSERRPNSRACMKTKGQILERPGALAR